VTERSDNDPWKGMMRRAKTLTRAAKALERLAAA
jgi:hypothetical protein